MRWFRKNRKPVHIVKAEENMRRVRADRKLPVDAKLNERGLREARRALRQLA